MPKRQNVRTTEILEPFTFADGAVRLAWVKWRLWNDPRTGSPQRKCLGVREVDAAADAAKVSP
jgi:hypothetical protein